MLANKLIQSTSKYSANETVPTTATIERINQITQLESEIDAKRAEIDKLLRIDEVGDRRLEKLIKEMRDVSNEPANQPESALREESLGEIIVLWEQPKSEPRGERIPANGSSRHCAHIDTTPDVVSLSSYESGSDETSIGRMEAASNPPSPRSPGGLFDHLLRPFGSGTEAETSSPPHRRPLVGLVNLTIPSLNSPESQPESVSYAGLLKKEINAREQKIEMLEEAISSDMRIMKKMNDTIERLSIELLSAKRSEQMLTVLTSRKSSLEDEVEELRVENTKLRINSQMLEEEKRRTEEEMTTELELLHIETALHKVF